MRSNMKWINSTDLSDWADRRDCQEILPLVIRRLIRATVTQINFISFPAGENIVYPGWDGILKSSEETEYIPKGLSVWEISTAQDIKKKAEADYQKRKQNTSDLNPSETIFIFVTPRIWTGKEKWASEKKKKDNFWRDVRVYDARDLEEWIEQSPAVAAWLARYIGKYPENVLSLEDWWREWSQVTKPPLIPDLLLGGRKDEKEKILNWLRANPCILSVQSFTKDEVIGFLASVILTLPENEKEYFLSKALIVNDENSFRHITTTCKHNLVLIPKFENVEFAISYSSNHHIFIPLSPENVNNKDKIVLSRIDKEEFISALEKMGIERESAEKYSKDTARIISVLRRQMNPILQPEWVKRNKAIGLLPALLLGKWDESKQGDKDIVSEIAGKPYDEFIKSIKEFLFISDPPILKIGETWRMTSFIDAFFVLSPFLTNADFENFKNVSLKVLKEIDPALEIAPEKRWMASVYGKVHKYSRELREGVAQTLVLIATFGDKVNQGRGLDLPITSQSWVNNIISELLKNAKGKLWYSLSDVLPLIAEASPSSFLDAVEDSLSQNPSPIMEMFSEIEDAFASHSAHPSLLWALEGLAWSPELLGRVTLILGKLAKMDPGGRLANRPINSLRNIFLLWFPQTFANLEQRLGCLDLLIEKEQEIAWDLLINLLPLPHDTCFPNYKPRWRQFSEKTENKVTIKEHSEGIIGIVDRILRKVGNNGKRWYELMEHFSNIPLPEERRKILDKLSECINSIDEGKFELWNKLRKILSLHRSFSNTERALPERELIEIEKLYNKLEPKTTIKRHQWLFDDWYPDLPEGKDYKGLEKIISQKRKDAIQSIKNEAGINGIIELASKVKHPQFVGTTLSDFSLTDKEERILFSLLDSKEQNKISLVQSYIRQKSFKNGDVFVMKVVGDAISEKWSSEKVVNLFLSLPQNKKVWSLLENFNLEIQQGYWEKVNPLLFDSTTEDKLYILEQLIRVKRHFTALGTAAMFKGEIAPKLVFQLLMKAALEESKDNFNIVNSWDIEELFKIIDGSEEITKDEIAQLEWLYLPILARVGGRRPPKMLHQELSENSEFFAEVIRYVYRPKNKDAEEEKDLSEELKQKRAYLAWELLNSWKIIPGSDGSGKIDYNKLKTWVDKARKLCKEADRLDVCDIHIGQVLAHAIEDKNGNWPPEEVCKIIEEIESKGLDKGFRIGIYNKRGIVSKALFEGGEQERRLAEQYRNYADNLANKFPRTSAILKKVAELYENEAKREDKEAEKRNLEW